MSSARLAQRLLKAPLHRSRCAAQQTSAQQSNAPFAAFFTDRCSVPGSEQNRQQAAPASEASHILQHAHPGARDLPASCTASMLGVRSMQQRMQQRSAFAALAEPWQDEASESTQQLQDARPSLQQQQQQAAESHLHRRHLPPVPSVEEVRQQLRSHGGAGCSSAGSPSQQAQPPATDGGALDWRHLVAALRSGQQARPAPGDILTDTFQRRHSYLRISLTERCNLRCLYCMPAQGVDLSPSRELLTSGEILRLARLFAGAGISKIRLTGGEPTLRSDITELTGQLAGVPGIADVGITTNGIALSRKLPDLQAAGLSLLNISLDTLRPERFEAMTRRRGLHRVLDTLQQAVGLGYDPVKVNVVVMRGQNDDELLDFVELTRDAPLNVRFIEYMPFDGNVWAEPKMVPYREMLGAVQAAYPQGLDRCQDARGEVAKNFRVRGHRGTVSFVTSMTSAFCGDCNRLRLMADGNLKVCLFGANEVSLRDAMREGATDDELAAIISAAVDRKKAAHAGMFELARTPNRSMVKIGG